MIDKATVQRITEVADIVDVVSDYVNLTRRGANYMGLCPFHNERTPSFSVNKARNFCFCFSCKKGGSPINFIMQKEGISYREALLQLAKKYNIPVEEKELNDSERESLNKREGMYLANEWAMKKMEYNLHNTNEGKEIGLTYLYQREITPEAIKEFHLGYSLDSFDALSKDAVKEGYSLPVLKELGVVGTTQNGKDYDRFRGRVIFPIINNSGRIIGFGGRDLKGAPAKYINSPESEIYKKSNELYGIYQARQSIVREDKVFLVEGYMDVIGMWQSGMKNVVASSGTALTDGQINLLHRFTNNITLIYDGDEAGIKASLRGMNMLLSHNLKVRVMLLPDGDDPDSFARKHTPEEFAAFVDENETDIITFKVKVLSANHDLSDPLQRLDVVKGVVDSIAHIPDKMMREIYIQQCSRMLSVSEETIASEVNKLHLQILEKAKKERTLRKYPVNESNSDSLTYSPSNVATMPNEISVSDNISTKENQQIIHSAENVKAIPPALYAAERDLIRYCVRYGFTPFCEGVDEFNNKCTMTLIEYVDDELACDNISLKVNIYNSIYNILINALDDFKSEVVEFERRVNSEIDILRKEGINEIGGKSLSFDEIKKEENILEENLSLLKEEKLFNLCANYSGNLLANIEDDIVRAETTKMLAQPHSLSKLYARTGRDFREEKELNKLIPNSLVVLKGAIIDIAIKEKMTEFGKAQTSSDYEQQQQLLAEINNLMQIRREIADVAGGRIINPRK